MIKKIMIVLCLMGLGMSDVEGKNPYRKIYKKFPKAKKKYHKGPCKKIIRKKPLKKHFLKKRKAKNFLKKRKAKKQKNIALPYISPIIKDDKKPYIDDSFDKKYEEIKKNMDKIYEEANKAIEKNMEQRKAEDRRELRQKAINDMKNIERERIKRKQEIEQDIEKLTKEIYELGKKNQKSTDLFHQYENKLMKVKQQYNVLIAENNRLRQEIRGLEEQEELRNQILRCQG